MPHFLFALWAVAVVVSNATDGPVSTVAEVVSGVAVGCLWAYCWDKQRS